MADYNGVCNVFGPSKEIKVRDYEPGKEFEQNQFQCHYRGLVLPQCCVHDGKCDGERKIQEAILNLNQLFNQGVLEKQQRIMR